MGFFDTIKGIFSASTPGMRNGKKAFFVDCARIADEKTGRRLSPRDQISLLNALARIHEEEGFDIAAIFESDRPLREVNNGEAYRDVVVYFAPDAETLIADALRLAQKGSYTLVTSGPSLESKATEAKLPLFSSSTFRKAFLANLTLGADRRHHHHDRDDRGQRGDRPDRPSRRRDRRRGDRGPRRDAADAQAPATPDDAADAASAAPVGAQAPAEPPADAASADSTPPPPPAPAPAPAPAAEASPAVRNLIDLVE